MYNLVRKKRSGSGSYSSYYRISKQVGIKALVNTYEDALELAKREFQLLKLAFKSGITPRAIGVVEVEFCHKFRYSDAVRRYKSYGIMMQHIDGVSLSEYCLKFYDGDTAEVIETITYNGKSINNYIDDIMQSVGIDYRDIHGENIIVKHDDDGDITDVYLIDFSPNYCYEN